MSGGEGDVYRWIGSGEEGTLYVRWREHMNASLCRTFELALLLPVVPYGKSVVEDFRHCGWLFMVVMMTMGRNTSHLLLAMMNGETFASCCCVLDACCVMRGERKKKSFGVGSWLPSASSATAADQPGSSPPPLVPCLSSLRHRPHHYGVSNEIIKKAARRQHKRTACLHNTTSDRMHAMLFSMTSLATYKTPRRNA